MVLNGHEKNERLIVMAKRTDSPVVKVSGHAALAKHIDADHSMDDMAELVILPRVKIIQSMSDSELKKRFGEGSAVVFPGDAFVIDASGDATDGSAAFDFNPLFFYQEYCKWKDIKDKTKPSVVERSFDSAGKIALMCKDRDTRFEVYAEDVNRKEKDQRQYRYVNHLRFIGIISGEHDLAGTTVTVTFERGEFQTGRSFISAIKMRKITVDEEYDGKQIKVRKTCPLWAQVWQFSIGLRPGELGEWYGFNFEPADEPIIADHDIDSMRAAHDEYTELHKKQRLRVDEDADIDEDEAENEEL